MANIITLAMLIENEACEEQVNLFKKYFGDSVEITEELCFKYYGKFDVDWLVCNMLNEEQKEAYEAIEGPAMAAYEAIEGSARESYLAIVGPARETYRAIEGSARESYLAIQGPAYEDYEAIEGSARESYLAIQGPAWEDYKKEKAKAFCVAYNS